jgi:hypothetical protein
LIDGLDIPGYGSSLGVCISEEGREESGRKLSICSGVATSAR